MKIHPVSLAMFLQEACPHLIIYLMVATFFGNKKANVMAKNTICVCPCVFVIA